MKLNLIQKLLLLVFICLSSYIFYTFLKFQILNLMIVDKTYGPLTLEDAKPIVHLPLHVINQASPYSNLEEIYYYFYDVPELRLATYFVLENKNSEDVRVAKMVTHNVWGGPGPYDTTNQEITIAWASSKIGHGCKSFADGARGDRILGESYRSCFYWFDKHNQYVLYTIWSEEETEEFVNSLIQAE